jgi:hypothetical protein
LKFNFFSYCINNELKNNYENNIYTMGVINSKNIKGVKGDENNNGFTNPEEENNAEVPDEAPEEAVPEEALSGQYEAEMKKQNNMKKWAPFFKELFKNPDFKVSIKAGIKANNEISGDSKLIADENDIEKYLNGDEDYIDYITDDLDKIYLFNPPETKALFEELTKGSEDQPIRTLSKEITGAVLIEKMKEIAKIISPNIQRAVKHKALREVINYLVDTDAFNQKHTATNIESEKDSIMKGEKSANEAALKKEKSPEEGGGDTASIHSSGSNDSSLSGGSLSSRSLSGGSLSGRSISGGSLSGGSIDEGGGVFKKSAEEKQFKEFEKGQKADINQKKILFMKDIPTLNKFIDTNENELIPIYSKNKIGKNVDKSAPKTNIIERLFEAVDSYIKEPDMAGAAGASPELPANDVSGNAAAEVNAATPAAPAAAEVKAAAAPAAPAGPAEVKAAPAESGGTSGGNNTTTTSAGDQAIQLAAMIKETLLKTALETTGLQNPKSSASSNPIGKAIEILDKPSVPQTGGGTTNGENEIKKRKKKRGKKPKHINISINVGNKNMIIDETSSSSSNSDSDSSSSHDDTTSTSSSSSDDEDNREKKDKHKQHKNKRSKNKKGKYVVNNK